MSNKYNPKPNRKLFPKVLAKKNGNRKSKVLLRNDTNNNKATNPLPKENLNI